MNNTAILGLLALLAVSACDSFDNPAPDEARVLIQGEAGALVRVIVSTRFVAGINDAGETRVEILQSDTVITTLPFDKVYDIEADQRFFVEAARLDDDLENVRMQVFLDNRVRFDEAGTLIEGTPYRFVFAFNQVILRDISVL
jgi:hypothetical protein